MTTVVSSVKDVKDSRISVQVAVISMLLVLICMLGLLPPPRWRRDAPASIKMETAPQRRPL